MSRTIRIYNRLNLKKTVRYNVDDEEYHVPCGIPFTRRSWICMGRCPICRDPKREPRTQRRQLKRELAFELKQMCMGCGKVPIKNKSF